MKGLTGGDVVVCYGQVDVTRDLMEVRAQAGLTTLYESVDAQAHEPLGRTPYVTFSQGGEDYRLDCDFVVGCDGFHGISRQTIPKARKTEYEWGYPFGWLGLLSETAPVDEELIYCKSERGFRARQPAIRHALAVLPSGAPWRSGGGLERRSVLGGTAVAVAA